MHAEWLIRHLWTEQQLNQDVRNNPGESHPYLLYPRRSQLRIAYSPVQWTWRMCELMRSRPAENASWLRTVDLPTFCNTATLEHGARITELGQSVADILLYGAAAPTFTSTLLPTLAGEAGTPFKAAFEEALVRGRVPEQGTALFVALDDPLALVDDLNMNLTGRLLAQHQFESLHQQRLQTALTAMRLCGLDVEAFIPDTVVDPLQRQAYTDDLYTLLKTEDDLETSAGEDRGGLADVGALSVRESSEAPFKNRWGQLPDSEKWQATLKEWHSKRLWRADLRFDEMQKYLSHATAQAQLLQNHCLRSEHDLLTWLDLLGPSGEAVYHDTCELHQATQLLHTAQALYTALGNGENGQQWLCRQVTHPSSLFGLALFNFNPEVAAMIKQVTHNFVSTGKLDSQGLVGDGSSMALSPTTAGDATNLGSRVNELHAVFSLESVQNSALYKVMSQTAKQAMATLIKVANDHARDAWHSLSTLLMPAMQPETVMTLVAPQVLISKEISRGSELRFNSRYQQHYSVWMEKVINVTKAITANQNVLLNPGAAHDQRAARTALHLYEQQLKTLFLSQPAQITARAVGSARLQIPMEHINDWLYDFGQSEVRAQIKPSPNLENLTRTNAWMDQHLGRALPVLLVGLNLWNLYTSAKKAQNDGRFTAAEWRTVSSNAAYAGNAIAALWVGPAWSRAGAMSTTLGDRTLK